MIKLPVFAGSWKKQRSSRETSNSASLTRLKLLIVWVTTNCGKFLKQWEYRPPYLSPDKPVSQIATDRTGRGTISVQFSSVPQSFPTFCDSINLNTPGLPVHHQLPESTQTHVHCVGDAMEPSHPLSSPYPPALNLSQHQGPFK